MTTLQEVYTEWQNNLQFRQQLKKDPQKALKDAGFQVSEEDMKKILSMLDRDQHDDEKLDDRISK